PGALHPAACFHPTTPDLPEGPRRLSVAAHLGEPLKVTRTTHRCQPQRPLPDADGVDESSSWQVLSRKETLAGRPSRPAIGAPPRPGCDADSDERVLGGRARCRQISRTR